MTTYRLTDAQIESALRDHVPAAPPDMRERVLTGAAATPQRLPMPRWLAPLADPGRAPIDRRLLLAASLVLLLLALVAAAVVGQQLLRPPSPDQLLQRTFGSMADPPAFEMELVTGAGQPLRLMSDGEGRIRFATTDLDDEMLNDWYLVLEPGRRGQSNASMQLYVNEARPDEPGLAEVWLGDQLPGWRDGSTERTWPPSPACTWAEPEALAVAGRSAHRLACPGLTLTIDDETGLPLAGAWVDPEGVATVLTATALRLVTPPAEAFRFEPTGNGIMDLTDPPKAAASAAPVDAGKLVSEALAAFEHLPPFSAIYHDSQGSQVGWSYDGDGTVRMDHWGNRAMPGPTEAWIASPGFMTRIEDDGTGQKIGVDYTSQPDPRLEFLYGLGNPCADWTYLGLDTVVGRDTHHVEGCGVRLWLDTESRIVLRSEGFALMDGVSDPPRLDQRLVVIAVEFELGMPPAERFDRAALVGDLERISEAEQQCRQDPAACPTPGASVEPPDPVVPLPAPPVADAPSGATTDPEAVVAAATARHGALPPLDMTIREQSLEPTNDGRDSQSRVRLDGADRRRVEYDWDLDDPDNTPTVMLHSGNVMYEAWESDEGDYWRRYEFEPRPGATDLPYGYGIDQGCGTGWQHAGFATILDRPTHHLTCDLSQWWVDVATGMVLRFERAATFTQPSGWITEVVALEEAPQAAELFELPPGAVVRD